MSFSKTSIFCLILLMAFIAAPVVMAHTTHVASHTHPLTTTVEEDLNGNGDIDDQTQGSDGNAGDERILPHDDHPTVTLKVEGIADGTANEVKVVVDDDDTTNVREDEFTLLVEFSEKVDSDRTTTNITSVTSVPFERGDFSIKAVNETTGGAETYEANNGFTITRVSGSLTKYQIVIRASAAIIALLKGDTTADPPVPSVNISYRIRFNPSNVYSLQTTPVLDDIPGVENYASNTLVVRVTSGTPDATKPTLTIDHTPTDGTMVGTDKVVTFTFTASEALAATGDGAFDTNDITVSANGTKGTLTQRKDDTSTTTVDESLEYTLPVTLTDVYQNVTVTVGKGSVADAAGNVSGEQYVETYTAATPESDPPTLVITHLPADNKVLGSDGVVMFTFTFTDASGIARKGDGAFTIEDISFTGKSKGHYGIKGPTITGTSTVYTLRVLAFDAYTDVGVSVKAGSVTDASYTPNALAAAVAESWTAPAPPTVTLTVSHSPADKTNPTSGKVTFTFTANVELPSTGPGALAFGDIGLTGGTATAADFAQSTTDSKKYTLDVTPNATAGQNEDVSVTVAAGAVSDIYGNVSPNAATGDLTWMAEDTTKPTVAITSSPKDRTNVGASGTVVFTFTFSEPLGSNDAGFTNDDIAVTGHTGIPAFAGSGLVYTYTVTPADPKAPAGVTVTVGAGKVSDAVGNAIADTSYTWKPQDETPPTVVISSEKNRNAAGEIIFIFTFSEALATIGPGAFTSADIDRVSSDVALIKAEPAIKSDTKNLVYTLRVEPKPEAAKGTVNIILKSGSVTDRADPPNALEGDQSGSWKAPQGPTPEDDKPVVTIARSTTATARNTEGYPDSGYLDAEKASENEITITVTDNVGILDSLTASEVTATNGTLSGFTPGANTDAKRHTFTVNVLPDEKAQFVTINVAADVVADAAGNTNNAANWDAANSKVVPFTIEVAPIIRVPADTYLVLLRHHHQSHTVISDQGTLPYRGSANLTFRHNLATWEHMPDLRTHFATSLPGTGGGALFLKKAKNQPDGTTTVNWGTVAISEIMWARDDGTIGFPAPPYVHRSDDWEARHQWIEIHNRNSYPVNVHIYARSAAQLRANFDGQELVSPESDVVDVVSNYFNGNRGIPRWAVPGENGNTATGLKANGTQANFISMKRNAANATSYKDGRASASWEASSYVYYTTTTSHTDQARKVYHHIGTPGRINTFSDTIQRFHKDKASVVPSSPVIFNEIANRSNADKAYEWIELRNVTNDRQNIRAYKISVLTGVGNDKDKLLCEFGETWIEPNSVLLLLASNPYNDPNHPISVGHNVDLPVQVRGVNENSPRYKVITFQNGGLPDHGNFVLFLRGDRDGRANHFRAAALGDGEYVEVATVDRLKVHQLQGVVDIAGYHPNLTKNPYDKPAGNPVSKTDFWPLTEFGRHSFSNNKIEVNKVHRRRHVKTNKGHAGGAGAWDNNNNNTALTDAEFTGLGYRRGVLRSDVLGGTPGYHNAVKNEVGQLTTGEVVISEIMLSQGPEDVPPHRKLPQWLELHNTSKTEAVNLAADDGWRLIIEMHSTDKTIGAIKTINFGTKGNVKVIEPNESILVVSGRARSYGSSTHLRSSIIFPTTRVYNVWQEQGKDFGMDNNQLAPILPLEGFHIKLVDGKGTLSDEIGNIDGHNRTSWNRDIPKWNYPNSVTEKGSRSSLIRIYDNGIPRNGVNMEKSNVRPLGGVDNDGKRNNPRGIDPKYSWIHAADTGGVPFYAITHQTWWGAETDHGTPIQRANAPLPVELSAFQPTLEDGKVVIRWTTESELDNAGFNIYRSETRNGEFKQVNAQLIEGAGTTGERNAYEWVDTTAKPDVVYYYQIEDVSFSGERQTLAQSRLKGYVSAKNKLTTRWGELKKTLQ